MPLQHAERLGTERLGTEAHAIDTRPGQDIGLLGVERAGIRLDRPLAAGAEDQPAPDDRGQPLELSGIQPGRRPSADEDGVDTLRLTQRHRQLAIEGCQVAIRQVIDAGQGCKVAIAALVGAKGDMDVGGAGPLPPRLGIARDGVPNHGTASTKRATAGWPGGTRAVREMIRDWPSSS